MHTDMLVIVYLLVASHFLTLVAIVLLTAAVVESNPVIVSVWRSWLPVRRRPVVVTLAEVSPYTNEAPVRVTVVEAPPAAPRYMNADVTRAVA